MNYIIGIDIGTTNTKAVAYDMDGRVLQQSNKSYPFISEQEGYHELDPKVLFDAFIEVLTNAVSQTTSHELCGVSFSAAMHGLMAVDERGSPLTNMITWADLRSNSYAVELKNSPAGKKIYERTGTPIHPMTPLCKLMWMKDHLPEIFTAAHKFISIKEYIFFHLFGEFVIDRSVASSTGLLDIYTRNWNEDALSVTGITAERLSKPVDATFIVQGLKSSLSNVPDVPFIIGASDGCLAHLGSNAMHDGDISLTIGTSGAVRIMTDKPVHDPLQRIFK
jgi:gluconokinase